jgi:hypothetical protein
LRLGDGGGDDLIGYPVPAQTLGKTLHLRVLQPSLIPAQALADVSAKCLPASLDAFSESHTKRWPW